MVEREIFDVQIVCGLRERTDEIMLPLRIRVNEVSHTGSRVLAVHSIVIKHEPMPYRIGFIIRIHRVKTSPRLSGGSILLADRLIVAHGVSSESHQQNKVALTNRARSRIRAPCRHRIQIRRQRSCASGHNRAIRTARGNRSDVFVSNRQISGNGRAYNQRSGKQ